MDYLNATERYPENFADRIRLIREWIELKVGNDPKFNKVSFCDVSAGYIQINMIHADEPNYIHYHVRLEYDFSNAAEAMKEAVDLWQEQRLVSHSNFYRQGERWGWD